MLTDCFMKLWGPSDFVTYTEIFMASLCFTDGFPFSHGKMPLWGQRLLLPHLGPLNIFDCYLP